MVSRVFCSKLIIALFIVFIPFSGHAACLLLMQKGLPGDFIRPADQQGAVGIDIVKNADPVIGFPFEYTPQTK